MSFDQKRIEVHMTLQQGSFSAGGNTKIIKGLPVTIDVNKGGFPSRDSAKVRIYGMRQSDMEALTFLSFRPFESTRSIISVYAGTDKEMGLVFMGDVTGSKPVFDSAPNVFLEVEAMSGYYAGLVAEAPYTFKGDVPVSTVLSDLCGKIDCSFVNENGESVSIKNPCLEGTVIQQIMQLARECKLNLVLDGEKLIWRKDKGGKVICVLSDKSGMFNYPSFNNNGLSAKCEYLPCMLGDTIQVKSIVPRATGYWKITGISHSLGYLITDAPWMTSLECVWGEG